MNRNTFLILIGLIVICCIPLNTVRAVNWNVGPHVGGTSYKLNATELEAAMSKINAGGSVPRRAKSNGWNGQESQPLKVEPVWQPNDPSKMTTVGLTTPKSTTTTPKPPPSSDGDDDKKDSTGKVIIAVCVSIGCIILLIIIGVILCVVFREKISHTFFSSDKGDTQGNAPGSIFYSPHQFEHKGALKIQKQAPVNVNADYPDEKDSNPPNAHFQFTDQSNEVYDIGSEVEQII